MTGSCQVSPGVRDTLTAPRGHRFSHTRTGRRPMPATREELFEQMMEHPKVRYRVERGEVPEWMRAATPSIPHPRPAPDDNPRPQPPPLPRRPRSHRKPRRTPWRLITYTLTAAAGALAQHLVSLLL